LRGVVAACGVSLSISSSRRWSKESLRRSERRTQIIRLRTTINVVFTPLWYRVSRFDDTYTF